MLSSYACSTSHPAHESSYSYSQFLLATSVTCKKQAHNFEQVVFQPSRWFYLARVSV